MPVSGWRRAEDVGLSAFSLFAPEIRVGRLVAGSSIRAAEELLAPDAASAAERALTQAGIFAEHDSVGVSSARNIANGTRLNVELSLKQAGILDEAGNLTMEAIKKADVAISRNSVLSNPKVISELTKDGSAITDWTKKATKSVELSNGQKIQIHFYQNELTGEINYNIDFKVKGTVSALPVKPVADPRLLTNVP